MSKAIFIEKPVKKVVLYDAEGKVLFETKHTLEAFFYDVCRDFGGRSHKSAVKLAHTGWSMYLKDDWDTPVGTMADFLAKVRGIDRFCDLPTYEQLEKFYWGTL
jgi:hypothetical protein